MKFPKQVDDVAWEKNEEAYVLVHPKTKEPFQIDAVAFMIWAQCDGKTSVDKIIDLFSLGSNKEVVKASVNGVIDRLKEAGFIK